MNVRSGSCQSFIITEKREQQRVRVLGASDPIIATNPQSSKKTCNRVSFASSFHLQTRHGVGGETFGVYDKKQVITADSTKHSLAVSAAGGCGCGILAPGGGCRLENHSWLLMELRNQSQYSFHTTFFGYVVYLFYSLNINALQPFGCAVPLAVYRRLCTLLMSPYTPHDSSDLGEPTPYLVCGSLSSPTQLPTILTSLSPLLLSLSFDASRSVERSSLDHSRSTAVLNHCCCYWCCCCCYYSCCLSERFCRCLHVPTTPSSHRLLWEQSSVLVLLALVSTSKPGTRRRTTTTTTTTFFAPLFLLYNPSGHGQR